MSAGLEERASTADVKESSAFGDAGVALLTGGGDRPYAYGLATALIAQGASLDVIAGDELESEVFRNQSDVRFLNLRGDQRSDATPIAKVSRVFLYYIRLCRYALSAEPRVFHILWNNKFDLIDRTALMLYYRVLGKKIVLTVHNVNAGRRDANDSFLNRLTLKTQYRLADHLFVHTPKMRDELIEAFGVPESLITVVPFGINNSVPDTALTSLEAKQRLGLTSSHRAILFFGNIAPYKGLEYLLSAFKTVVEAHPEYRLIIAGRPKGPTAYWQSIQNTLSTIDAEQLVSRIDYVPDEETELYFKAADVLVLPYTEIFQSGVLFLGYSFGLPVLAADVGSLAEDIVEGETGFAFKARDSADLARTIQTYFATSLFSELPNRRERIRRYANERYSWTVVGEMSRKVYSNLVDV